MLLAIFVFYLIIKKYFKAAGGRKNINEWKINGEQQQLCLHKWTLGGVFGTLLALIIVQSGVVAKHLINRFIIDKRINSSKN